MSCLKNSTRKNKVKFKSEQCNKHIIRKGYILTSTFYTLTALKELEQLAYVLPPWRLIDLGDKWLFVGQHNFGFQLIYTHQSNFQLRVNLQNQLKRIVQLCR